MKEAKCFRGVAEAIAALIALLVISITVLYFVFYGLEFINVGRPRSTSSLVDQVDENIILAIIESRDDEGGSNVNSLLVVNTGIVSVIIDHVIVHDSYNYTPIVINARSSVICTSESNIISPGSSTYISCINRYIPVAVVTRRGKVFSLDPHVYTLKRRVGMPIRILYGGIAVHSTSSLYSFLEEPSVIESGSVSTSINLIRIYSALNTSIRGIIDASSIIIGVNPVNGKYNMLIIGAGNTSSISHINISETSGVKRINLSTNTPRRFRIKIEGFEGFVNLSSGIHPCYVNNARTCVINISGVAESFTLYGSNTSTPGVTGYDPYLFVGDIDGNGNVETFLVTQDFNIGNSSVVNDILVVGSTRLNYTDVSIKPFRLIFRDVLIDGRRHLAAILSIKLFFWDNSLDDISDNDNRVIVRIGLCDVNTKRCMYSAYLTYFELNRYRNVKPLVISHLVKDFIIDIPHTNTTYNIVLEIEDPFYVEGNKNDADVVIGLEYAGITLSTR